MYYIVNDAHWHGISAIKELLVSPEKKLFKGISTIIFTKLPVQKQNCSCCNGSMIKEFAPS